MLEHRRRNRSQTAGRRIRVALAAATVALVSLVAAPQALADGVLDVGFLHACVVEPDGDPVCWGWDEPSRGYTHVSDAAGKGPLSAITTGLYHSCGIQTDGTPVCWGNQGAGGVSGAAGQGPVTAISAGAQFTCAMRTDQTPVCWGQTGAGVTSAPDTVGPVTSISSGHAHACAVTTDGTPMCWGVDGAEQSSGAVGKGPVTSISAGKDHTCAIAVDGTPFCWGSDAAGQRTIPAGVGAVKAISAGWNHTCAIKTDGTAVCWGKDDKQQASVPGDLGTVIAIAAGDTQSCAITTAGNPVCWGTNAYGPRDAPLGTGPVGPSVNDTPPTISATAWNAAGAVTAVTADPGTWRRTTGFDYEWRRCTSDAPEDCTAITGLDAEEGDATYTLTSADVGSYVRAAVTGRNATGESTAVTPARRVKPLGSAPQAPTTERLLDAGDAHTCAVKTDGTPSCWGGDNFGQAASGVPAQITVGSISAGHLHTCAVKTDETPVCWGDGEAASGVPAGITVSSISAGGQHSCAVKTDGSPVCWGTDHYQQAASGVPAGIAVGSISAGGAHTCAVKTDGTPVCWGRDDRQQAASGVPAGITVSSISAGGTHTCAVKTDGTPVCWGYDAFGQAASGVPAGIAVRSISAGGYHSCAIKTDGIPVCWGYDGYGQAASGMPAQITVSSISAGTTHTCAIKTDGTPVCWGDSSYGQAHIPDGLGTIAAPANIEAPSISVTESVAGEIVVAHPGRWTRENAAGENGPEYTYAWQRCGDGGCEPTGGGDDDAHAQHYILRDEDDGYKVRAMVTSSNAAGATTVPSPVTATVRLPVPTTEPSVSGGTRTGDVLALDVGAWTGTPTDYFIEWLRCDDETLATCSGIKYEFARIDATYTLEDGDDGKRIRARVIAENGDADSLPVTTAATAVIDIPTLISAPSISGTTRTGDTLTANPGQWTGEPTSHDVEWLRCASAEAADCVGIESGDATDGDLTYTLVDADDASRIRVRAAGVNAGGSGTPSTSEPTEIIDIPALLAAPSISGTTRTGDTLTVDRGDWTGDPTGYAIEWLQCTTTALDSCTPISSDDATDQNTTYQLVDADDGARIRARVTASNASGTGPAETSGPTAVIDLPTASVPPSISGTTKTGDVLTVDRGDWTGSPTGYTIEWLRCTTTDVADCTRMTSVDATNNDLKYTLVNLDDAKRIRARVTGRNAGGTGTPSTSEPTAIIDIPTLLTAPSLSGTTRTGDTVAVNTGGWTGNPTSYAIEWLRCTTLALDSCAPITSADATDQNKTYQLVDADDGARLRARVTASNAGGSGPASTSAATVVVDLPTNTKAPSISGTTKTGDVLTADVGDWTGYPTSYAIEWLRCTGTATTSCLKITSADATDNDATYTLVDADDARRIRTRVTARNAGGASAPVSSTYTAIVDIPTPSLAPSITGTTRTGDTLTVNRGQWTGNPTSYVVEWLRCNGLDLAGCTKIDSADATDNTTTYQLVDADDAKRIRVRVTATNAAGSSAPSTSASTVVIDVPTVRTAPTLSGSTKTDDLLTANPGTWSGDPTSYAVEWLRCSSADVADCVKIVSTDATNGDLTYTLVNADDAKRIRTRVAGRNAGGTGTPSTSTATAVVDIPTLLTAPAISGTTRTGDTLTLNTGGWTGNPTAYAIEWLRCTTIYLAHCTPITGTDATDQNKTYQLTDEDDGARIRARVAARNAGGAGPASTSAYTVIVDLPTASKAPSITGSTKTGDTLTLDRGEWTGAPTAYTIEWLRCTGTDTASCTKILSTDATNGDLVYKLVDADDAKRIRGRVTGKNAHGTGTPATSAATAVIDLPTLINAPVVTGTAQVGQPLTTTRGDWTGGPTRHTIEWLRCTTIYLTHCTAITSTDATDNDLAYTPVAADQGARIRSRVQPHNAGGDGPKTPSLYTKAVVAAP